MTLRFQGALALPAPEVATSWGVGLCSGDVGQMTAPRRFPTWVQRPGCAALARHTQSPGEVFASEDGIRKPLERKGKQSKRQESTDQAPFGWRLDVFSQVFSTDFYRG